MPLKGPGNSTSTVPTNQLEAARPLIPPILLGELDAEARTYQETVVPLGHPDVH